MNVEPAKPAPTNVCPQCGARFRCGMEGGDQECWCAGLPPLLPLPVKTALGESAPSCLCRDCLRARLATAEEIRAPR